MQTSKWPLDFDVLDKGDIISASTISSITGISRDSKHYSLETLKLKDEIERQLRLREKPCTIAIRNDDLHILDDADSAAYNPLEFQRGLAKSVRAHYRMLTTVNVSNLTVEQRQDYERNIEVQGKQLQAVAVVKQVCLPPATRKTPGLVKAMRS